MYAPGVATEMSMHHTIEMKVGYIYSQILTHLADETTPPTGRSSRVHALIQALGLIHPDSAGRRMNSSDRNAYLLFSEKAQREDLSRIHSSAFVGGSPLALQQKRADTKSSFS